MTEKQKNKEQIWETLFIIIPVLILVRLGDNFAINGIHEILYSGLFGAIGGVLGYGAFHLSKKHNLLTKIIILTVITVISIMSLFIAHNLTKKHFLTCEVCGYIAVDSKKQECEVCGNVTWEKEKTYGEQTDKNVWLIDEQLFWFEIDSITQQIDFYSPKQENGFIKDNNWKPIISKKNVIEHYEEITGENK